MTPSVPTATIHNPRINLDFGFSNAITPRTQEFDPSAPQTTKDAAGSIFLGEKLELRDLGPEGAITLQIARGGEPVDCAVLEAPSATSIEVDAGICAPDLMMPGFEATPNTYVSLCGFTGGGLTSTQASTFLDTPAITPEPIDLLTTTTTSFPVQEGKWLPVLALKLAGAPLDPGNLLSDHLVFYLGVGTPSSLPLLPNPHSIQELRRMAVDAIITRPQLTH